MSLSLALLVALAGTAATPDLKDRPEPWKAADWCPDGTRRVTLRVKQRRRLLGKGYGKGPAYACIVDGSSKKKEGPFVAFHKTVKWSVAALGTYRADKAEGTWSYFDWDGVKKEEGEYRLGLRHGLWRRLNTVTGKTKMELHYVKGKRHGPCRKYRRDGSLEAEGPYERGYRSGTWRFFWPNGRPSAVGPFHKGAKHGVWRIYDATGREITSTRMEHGAGRWVELWPDGTKKGEGHLAGNLKHGVWNYWHENGTRSEQLRFHHGGGCRRGRYQRWHPNGTRAVSGRYDSRCRKARRWFFWAPDGVFQKGTCYRRSNPVWTSEDEQVARKRGC